MAKNNKVEEKKDVTLKEAIQILKDKKRLKDEDEVCIRTKKDGNVNYIVKDIPDKYLPKTLILYNPVAGGMEYKYSLKLFYI